MKEVSYKKLLSSSTNKSLFRQELISMVNAMDKEDQFDLLTFCYKHFSDLFPDVLLEVFYPEKNFNGIKKPSDDIFDQQHKVVE